MSPDGSLGWIMCRTNKMKIVRTFHPIGQGAFYSERFFEDSECRYNVVYDCGVLNVKQPHKRVVQQAFSKDDTIDYLFISHFDEDHISLITTLKQSVRHIKNVVMPFINLDEVRLYLALSNALDLNEVYDFLGMVYNAITGQNRDDTNYFFVSSEGNDYQAPISRKQILYNGVPISLFKEWIYIPYNKDSKRKRELENNLKELIGDAKFQEALKQKGLRVKSVDELKDLMTHETIADLIDSVDIRCCLNKVYKDITGTINQNSLLVYSGPPNENTNRIRGFIKWTFCGEPYWPWFRSNRVACLYTGDSDLDIRNYKDEFQNLWNNVGTIQLPHHGSYASFQFDKNKNEFDDRYVFPVSCGETNPYGHPSSKVLDFLMANNCLPLVVTENASTRYSQVIRCKFPVKAVL